MPTNTVEVSVREGLLALADERYRAFHQKLVPNVDPERIIGVRSPALQRFGKALAKTPEAAAFLDCLPHYYVEENNLHGFLLSGLRDYEEVMARLEVFLPYVDNWATCDGLSPKVFKKEPEAVFEKVRDWLASEREYTVRFALVTLLGFFLDEHFRPEGLELAAALRREEYYIRMANAWYFSVALVKQYEAALPTIEQRRLDRWTHNKAIQKAVESYRVSAEHKAYLKSLRWKNK